MARLADLIHEWKWFPPRTFDGAAPDEMAEGGRLAAELRGKIAASVVIDADAVCEYLFAGTDQEEWLYERDFPSCQPPHLSFFVEMKRPSGLTSTNPTPGASVTNLPPWWGWHFEAEGRLRVKERASEAVGAGDGASMAAKLEKLAAQMRPQIDMAALVAAASSEDRQAALEGLPSSERNYFDLLVAIQAFKDGRLNVAEWMEAHAKPIAWLLHATLVLATPGRIVGPSLGLTFELGAEGQILRKPFMGCYGPPMDRDFAEMGAQSAGPLIFPALLAISLMNRGKVKVARRDPLAPTRRQARDRKSPPVSYLSLALPPDPT
jgi:hypothetical protein